MVITDYSLSVADLFTLDDDIAQEGGNAALVASVRALGALSRMKDQASQQQAILSSAYAARQIQPDDLSTLTAAQAQQAADLGLVPDRGAPGPGPGLRQHRGRVAG